MLENEAQTRREIIDKRLLRAGWDVTNPTQVTEELDIWIGDVDEGLLRAREAPTRYKGHLFADYALLGCDGYPLAVVEAKKTSVDPRIGKEQARNYAEKIQKVCNKKIPFVFYTNGYDIYFWDTERYPPRKVYGFPTRDDLERIQFLRDNAKPLSDELINKYIVGRPYQIQAIRSILESIEKKRQKFLLIMATGTGKTRTCIALIDVLMRASWVQRVLFLVDRIALQEQALSVFKEFLPNAPVWPKQGESEIVTDRRVYVSTYPSILNIIEAQDCPLSPHFFDLIVADESHRSIYNVYKNIFDYFDSKSLGLTATPKDSIDHNTFKMFECDTGLPTFAYSYEEAVSNTPPYLCDFEVLRIRTKFQKEGINTQTISDAEKERLLADGQEITGIDFEGTELEKRVTNRGTNVVIVKTFMEESIKDPNGVLPGKTIFFAMTQNHALRLCEVFDALYPEYKGQLAEVITSNIKGVHGKGGLLERFIQKDMPRIAISVDMLDTGIDVREAVNLVFAKPVFSYTKFWQMIGRGTRLLAPDKPKPWCQFKDKFLVFDCWENFEYFKMHPKGKTEKAQESLPARLFRTRLDKLVGAIEQESTPIIKKVKALLQSDIQNLPQNSVVVLDAKSDLIKTEDPSFWENVGEHAKSHELVRSERSKDDDKIDFLRLTIAPVMRAISGVDFEAMWFTLDITELSIALIKQDKEQFEMLKEAIVEKIAELPLSVNVVGREKDLIERAKQPAYWIKATDDDLDCLIDKLSPLMKYRQKELIDQVKLDIQDILVVKEVVEFGPDKERLTTQKYREKVESYIQSLVNSNLTLQKLKSGGSLSELEIGDLAALLSNQDPYVTEDILRRVYDNRTARFIQFIKHILGLEHLTSFTETVAKAFDRFIIEHNTYSEQQIQFLLTLKTFIIQRGKVDKKDLVNAPFTQLHPQGIRGVFSPKEIEEILEFAYKIAA